MHDLPILHTKVFRVIDGLLDWMIVITSSALILMMTSYVVSRYVLKINFKGFEELAILIAIWLYFCGSAKACREQSQISADMLDMFVKNKTVVSAITVLYRIVGLIVVGMLIYLSWDFLSFNMKLSTTSVFWKIPMYFYHASLIFGFVLMFVFDFCYMIASVGDLRSRLRGNQKSEGGMDA